MKLKCRINNVDYSVSLVQGASFIDNFNETLDSGTIVLDQVKEIADLKPYDDVFIWDASEEFDGYYNADDFIFLTFEQTTATDPGTPDYRLVRQETLSPGHDAISHKPMFHFSSKDYTGSLSGTAIDLWFDRFLNYTEETKNNFRWQIGTGLNNFTSLPLRITFVDNNGNQQSSYPFLYINQEFFSSETPAVIKIYADNTVATGIKNYEIECSYDIMSRTITFNTVLDKQVNIFGQPPITNLTIVSVGLDSSIRYIYYNHELTKTFTSLIDVINLEQFNDLKFKVKYQGVWYHGNAVFSDEQPDNSNNVNIDFNVNIDGTNHKKTLTFSLENGKMKNVFEQTQPGSHIAYSTLWEAVDEFVIESVSIISDTYSTLPTKFFKHMLVDSFNRTRLQLNDSYDNPSSLYKYQINLFSETKKLEKIILPNISVTQSLDIKKKRSCWEYLENFVELYSPKYKKTNNKLEKTWQYIQKYSVSHVSNSYLTTNVNPHIVTNLKEIFENTICPEFSLTNPSLKDVLAQIMITKDLIPFVFNDVIYGLDIGATNLSTFNRSGTNFDSSNLNSENYATDARREYSNALSQENSAHLIEYLGFRSPNNTFLTLDNLTLETRFPIYKINSIKLCYYKKFTLTDLTTDETIDKVFFCKYDITKLVLQNVVRNTLSTNWQTFDDYENIKGLPTVEERLDFVSKYKLCTIGYDIGSNQISGWGTTYEYLKFLWFKDKKSYIENIIELLDAVSDVGTDVYKAFLQESGGEFPEHYSVSAVGGINGIIPLISSKETQEGVVANDTIKLKSIVFEVDYDAMYNGAIMHSKDYIDDDDIVTPDNCSAALTVLEADGLFEKEKMNRMSNPVFKTPARYDNDNGGPLFSRVQKLATYDELTDSIIYSREYQIYENVIFANYESTKEYVLKNYFTSVWAKYRTYNLMSYGESIKRAENFRELVILSKKKQYYEYENLFGSENKAFYENLLSFLKPTNINLSNGVIINNTKINCGYFVFNDKKYLSDINSFASGNSICFNISTYDNISGGMYIEKIGTFNMEFADYGQDVQKEIDDMKTTQNWYQMVADRTDAFTKTVGIYFCNLNTGEYYKDQIVSAEIVKENAAKFLALPLLSDDSYLYQSNIFGGDFNFNKDNKEKLDVTFQFDYIASLEDKDNILFSSWITKLNDYLGHYEKFEENQDINTEYLLDQTASFFVYQIGDSNNAKKVIFKISKDSLAAILQEQEDPDFESIILGGANFVNNFSFIRPQSIGLDQYSIRYVKHVAISSDLYFKEITRAVIDDIDNLTTNDVIKINYNFKGQYRYEEYTLFWQSGSFVFSDTKNGNFNLHFVSKDNNDFCYFEGEIPSEDFFTQSYFDYGLQRYVGFYWQTNYRGNNNPQLLNEVNSLVVNSVSLIYGSAKFDTTDETNMVLIISTNKLKNNLIYNSFQVNENNSVTLPEGMYFDTVGFNGLENGHIVSQIFSINGSAIDVNANLYNNYSQDIKSIQYYYKDNNGWLHFVFGVNVERNNENKYDNFSIFLSCVSKRNMKVYDDNHKLVGIAKNYVNNTNPDQLYGEGQYYEQLVTEEDS